MAKEVIGGSGLSREELEATCSALGRTIGDVLPGGVGFAFILCDLGAEGNMSYLSNAKREDMIKMLREMAMKMEDN